MTTCPCRLLADAGIEKERKRKIFCEVVCFEQRSVPPGALARLSPGVNENSKEKEWKVLTSRAARPKAKFLLPVVSVWLTSDTLSTQRRVCRSVISVYLRWQVWKGTQLSRSARQELSVLSRRHTGCFHVSGEAEREIIFQREVRWNLTPWVKKTTKRPHSNSLLLQKRRNRETVM